MADHFESPKTNKLSQFHALYNTPKTSYEAKDIVTAAVNGRIDTLFLPNDRDLYGTYDKENGHLAINESKEVRNVSLSHMVALNTILQNGNVYLLPSEEMPIKNTYFNALFRF